MADDTTEQTERYEFKVWAEGQLTDADGNPLDADGNPMPSDQMQSDESEPEEAQK